MSTLTQKINLSWRPLKTFLVRFSHYKALCGTLGWLCANEGATFQFKLSVKSFFQLKGDFQRPFLPKTMKRDWLSEASRKPCLW